VPVGVLKPPGSDAPAVTLGVKTGEHH